MNILFYIPSISKSYGGVYQYTISLLKILTFDKFNNYYIYNQEPNDDLKSLAKLTNNFFLISSQKDHQSIFNKRVVKSKEIINKVFKELKLNISIPNTSKLDKIINKYKIDILHCPYQHLPICNIPTITTMHDVQELHYPEFFSSEIRAYRAVNYKYAIDNASGVIVSFQHIKDDLIKYFSKNEEEIYVMLLDMKNLWFEAFSDKNINPITEFSIPNKFILYPASTWEHKNHLRLLEAISYLKIQKNLVINLVCTGNKTDYFKFIQEKMDILELNSQITFLGIVNDITLFNLYKKSIGVVIPTLYEAGSFPLVESILMKIPVICSNVTSLPEMIGNKNYIFDPYDITDLANKIESLYNDEMFRKNNVLNSCSKISNLIDNNTLKKINDIYNSIYKKIQL